jgi:hypothetical protein
LNRAINDGKENPSANRASREPSDTGSCCFSIISRDEDDLSGVRLKNTGRWMRINQINQSPPAQPLDTDREKSPIALQSKAC